MTLDASPHPLDWLRERAEVSDLVLRFALALDTHDWPLLRSCLDEQVEVDYSSFRGEPPRLLAAEEFVEQRRRALASLRMQHVSTNHLVEIQADAATCRSCFLIHRLAPALPEGANTLDSAGHYVHRLRRTEQGWRMTAITQTLLWSRGNPAVHGALGQDAVQPMRETATLATAHLRVARPTDNLAAVVEFYRDGLGMEALYEFRDHDGFDGVMLGHRGCAYHLEFTHRAGHAVGRAPTLDHLLVFYLPDVRQWREAAARLESRGYQAVVAFNPYWDRQGKTFEDPDGYRVVLQNASWVP